MKSVKLLSEYLADFDNQLFQKDEDLLLEDDTTLHSIEKPEIPGLLIKTPQPRRKKLTLHDLMQALEKALEVEERRKFRMIDQVIVEATIPQKKIDITELIKSIYEKIKSIFKMKEKLTFKELVNSDKKEDPHSSIHEGKTTRKQGEEDHTPRGWRARLCASSSCQESIV